MDVKRPLKYQSLNILAERYIHGDLEVEVRKGIIPYSPKYSSNSQNENENAVNSENLVRAEYKKTKPLA